MTEFAHSIEGKPVEKWHLLEDHLLGTAKLAAQFAAEFGCGEWGYLAGLWHDLGKKKMSEKGYNSSCEGK